MDTTGSNELIRGLEMEDFRSERLRSVLLITLFGIGLVISFVNYFFLDDSVMSVYGGSRVYFSVQVWIAIFIVYQIFILVYLKYKRSFPNLISLRFKLVNSILGVSYPTIFIYYSMTQQKLLLIMDSPIMLLYFLFIILSILHLDFKINILTGFLAAFEYSALTYYGFHVLDSESGTFTIPENSHYIRGLIFILCGAAAAFVSAELKKKIITSFDSQQAKRKIEFLFGQQVSREVSQTLIDGQSASKRLEATVMFLDIRNFTTYADSHSAEEVIEYQNKFLSPVIDIINQHQGVVFQILGDGLMACFGSPVENVLHADMAYQAGLAILKNTDELNKNKMIPDTVVGIGLHSGSLINGNIGSNQRKQFSVSGTPVIVASRIEQLNKKYNSRFLISEEVFQKITKGNRTITYLGEEPLRGLVTPFKIYRVEEGVSFLVNKDTLT